MADHKAPDYDLDDQIDLDQPEHFKALFEDTRMRIVDLLMERAATIKELSEALDKPKGTIGHHVAVLEEAGLIQIVRTEMVRAIEAKYYGRVARTYNIVDKADVGFELAPAHFLQNAAIEYARVKDPAVGTLSTQRYARIPDDRAEEWARRLADLAQEFTTEKRGGDTTFGLVMAIYPTDRPHLPDVRESS